MEFKVLRREIEILGLRPLSAGSGFRSSDLEVFSEGTGPDYSGARGFSGAKSVRDNRKRTWPDYCGERGFRSAKPVRGPQDCKLPWAAGC
mmetsp:Transcript_43270/g.67784  ORF Transcript_43270/g.67784 Transcript_43270/m.67784 type:complete len:90 (-) Transcript_43270:1436-1705(-)